MRSSVGARQYPLANHRRRRGEAFISVSFGRRGVKMFKTETKTQNLASLGTRSTAHCQQCTDMRCRDQFMRYAPYLGSHGACSKRHTEECSVLPHYQNTQNLQLENVNHHVNPSWDEYKIFTYLLQLAEMFTYVNLVNRVYKNGGYMHSFHYPVSTLTTAISASPFFCSCITVREPQW